MNTQQKGLHRTRDQLLLTPLIMHHIHVWHDFITYMYGMIPAFYLINNISENRESENFHFL